MSMTLDRQLSRLVQEQDFVRVTADTLKEFSEVGDSLLLLTAEPEQCPEAWDMLMVLPEALKLVGPRYRAGVVDPENSESIARTLGVELFPALVFQRDGKWVGKLEGMVDWVQLLRTLSEMLQAPLGRRPIGIPVKLAGCASTC